MVGKKTVVFLTNSHAGQLNPLIAIAKSLWSKCDQQNTEIVFVCVPKFLSNSKLAETIPTVKVVPLELSMALSQTSGFVSKPRDFQFLQVTGKNSLDLDYFKVCQGTIEDYLQRTPHKPDLLVMDIFSATISVTFRKYDIPYVMNIPLPGQVFFGSPITSLLSYPAASTGFSQKMTIYEKLLNILLVLKILFVAIVNLLPLIRKRNKYVEELTGSKNFPVLPNLVAKNARAIFVDSVFGFEYPYELPATATMIGACLDPKTIDECLPANQPDLDWITDRANVIYISLGTIAKPSKAYVINLLMSFQATRQSIKKKNSSDWHCLIKVPEGCYLPEVNDVLLENVRTVKWVTSQLDILKHRNVKLFVSHCGGNSVNEAIFFGKAILAIPQWYDCYDLAQRIQDAEIGLRVFDTVPEPKFEELQDKMLKMVGNIDGFLSASKKIMKKMHAAGGSDEAARKILIILNDNQEDLITKRDI
ncbi:hypothetical protein HK096_003133 [Nowakowskiella sp. JEL0078]|nr:hypothetical protein HK096_003133 [Nowakowskiella sp. JEL0078]